MASILRVSTNGPLSLTGLKSTTPKQNISHVFPAPHYTQRSTFGERRLQKLTNEKSLFNLNKNVVPPSQSLFYFLWSLPKHLSSKTTDSMKTGLSATSSLKHESVRGSVAMTTFNWPELKKGCCSPPYSGDCHQSEGKLVLQADGKAHFSCVTWTDKTHSGDYWHVGFEFLDSSGVKLFSSPVHIGPRMDDGIPPPKYRWEFDFTFGPNLYSKVAEVRQTFSC